MKRALSLLLACVLVLALLSACGGKDAAEQTPAPETPPTQTAATGGVDTSCKVYFPNDTVSDLRADTVHVTDTEAAVTVLIKTDEPRTLDFSGVRGFLVTNVCIVQRSAA